MHLIAFAGPVSAGATNSPLPAVTGTAEYVQNQRHVLQRDMYVLWTYIQGASITDARIDAPSLRAFALPRQPHVRRAALPGDEPPVNDWASLGLVLRGAEEIALQTSNNLGTGSETHVGIICIGDTLSPPPRGPEFWVKATGATTLAPLQWTNVPLTLESSLPAGQYRIVDLIARSATGVAARVISPGSSRRPGTVCVNAPGQKPADELRSRRYGDYGTFATVALPSVEFLATGADTSQEVYLGLVRA